MESTTMANEVVCNACNNVNSGNYCKDCGEDLHPKRQSLPTIIKTLPDLFLDVDHGLLFSITRLFKNPSQAIASYLKGDRSRHYQPLKFVLFMSGLYALLYIYFNIHGSPPEAADAATKNYEALIEEKTTELQSIINLVSLPFLSLTTWVIFGTKKMYYGEHLLMNSYIIGFVLLIQIILFPVLLIKNGTAWVDWMMTAVAGYTIIFANQTYYGLFYPVKSTGNFIVCLLKTIAIIILFAIFQLMVNPIVIGIKMMMFPG